MLRTVQWIFLEARRLPAGERHPFLQEACGTDVRLRSKIESLLEADAEAAGFLDDGTESLLPESTGDASVRPASPPAPQAPETHDSAPSADMQSTGRATGAPSPSGIPMESAGDVIGRYKLLEQVGEGGFGTVWLAEQREPVRRRVALKIIKLGMDTRQVIARFEAERQALALMDHPNIAKVLDAGSTEAGRPYFVMEYIRGVPIVAFCDRERLDLRARLELFVRVCQAIQHAHQKGVIHRDIKPSNILVGLHDGIPVPKVIDFGVAKATSGELTSRTLFTHHRQMVGTPAYMSPEQAEMSGLDIDTRSDVYSLGVLLYELLVGVTPLDSRELRNFGYADLMRTIREVEPPRPSTRALTLGDASATAARQRRLADPRHLATLLRGDLDWIVMKCLEKDRGRRYETASGLAADIQRTFRDEPITAGPPGTTYRLRKFLRRNRGHVVAACLVAIALILATAGTTTGLVWALHEKTRADAEAQRATRELSRVAEVKRLITAMLLSVNPDTARGGDTTLLASILDEAADRLAAGDVTDARVAAELHAIIGEVYRKLGHYTAAARHLPAALDLRTRELGDEHPDTLASLNSLALLYEDQGRYADAEPLHRRTLETLRRTRGVEHPDTVVPMNNLANLYWHQARYAEAEPLYAAGLEIRTRALGPEHPATASSMSNLAMLYRAQGRLAEAEPLYRQALEIRTKALGTDHPDTLGTMNGLGALYFAQRRYDEAERMYAGALGPQRALLGDDHPTTLKTANNLAALYYAQGRHAEAEPLFRANLEAQRRTLGEDHPDTLGTTTNLGHVYRALGRFDEARTMYETSLPLKRRVLGDRHPWTRFAMQGLAQTYLELGRRDDALALFRELLAPRLAAAAEPDADAPALNDVAWSLLRHDCAELRDPARAIELARRACARAEETGDTRLWSYLDTLALAEFETGDPAASVVTQRRALALMPPDAADRAAFETRLAEYDAAASKSAAGPAAPGS